MFLENLWRQMDKMSAAGGKSISKVAAGYIAEGYDDHEVVELLVDDGFELESAKACVASSGEDAESGRKWGFEVEAKIRGDIANNFDLGIDGVAGNGDAEAWDNAQAAVDSSMPDQYEVTRVFAL